MKYPLLFSPGKIGSLKLKNRVVMPAMGTLMTSSDGEITDHVIEYFRERARGGVGLIITEVTSIDNETGRTVPNPPRIDDVRYVPMFRRLTDTIHQYGTKIFVQLQHPGNEGSSFVNNGKQIVSCSEVTSLAIGEKPRALTTEEVKEFVNKFVSGAVLCQMAGMDGVEIHGAHGYLVNQFLSPHTNRRTDEYGGSFENRMRFASEIIEGIKEKCGRDFPVGIRLSVDEFTGYGIKLEEGIKIAQYMENVGADFLNVSGGTYESGPITVEPISYEQGWRVYLAEAVKKSVSVPVITVGVIREPQFAESILEANKADFVAIGRGQIADPDWCNKAEHGREKEIRKCISCMNCIQQVLSCAPLSCGVNARAGHEWQYEKLKNNGANRQVVVIGGGPAGIEAARVLATRGFKVVLFEKNPELGGQLQFANKPIGKSKINWFIEYGNYELNRLGVDVRLNCQANDELIKGEKPYAVFVATGANPLVPNIPGIKKDVVVTAEDFLSGKTDLRDQTVAVIGGGMTGCETAILLSAFGNRVCVVEMLPDVCIGADSSAKVDIMEQIAKQKVELLTGKKLEEVTANGISIKDVITGGSRTIEVDKVVLALGVRPENSLYTEIKNEYDNIFLIGDAVCAGRIVHAVKAGHVMTMELE